MNPVSVKNVQVLNSECPFSDPFQFEIEFECLQPLEEDLEWKFIYVGSAESESCDQELDCVMVGPVAVGDSKFTIETPGPDPTRIPRTELIGVTVLLVTCSYRGKEFTRVGYYVNNDYGNLELRENPPEVVDESKLVRNVLVAKPHVTLFSIQWDLQVVAAAANTNTNSMSNDAFLATAGQPAAPSQAEMDVS